MHLTSPPALGGEAPILLTAIFHLPRAVSAGPEAAAPDTSDSAAAVPVLAGGVVLILVTAMVHLPLALELGVDGADVADVREANPSAFVVMPVADCATALRRAEPQRAFARVPPVESLTPLLLLPRAVLRR